MKINNYIKKIKQFVGATLLLLSTASIAQPPPPPVVYCAPTYSNLCTSNDYVDNFFTTGGVTNISNLSSGCNGQANNYNYYDHYTMTIQHLQFQKYKMTIKQ